MLGAAAIMLVALGFIVSYRYGFDKGSKQSTIVVDTPDTTIIENFIEVGDPTPIEVEVIKTIYIHDTIWIDDENFFDSLDYERKIYRGLDYYCEVSGFEPQLDSIAVRHTTTYVERPIIMEKEIKPRLSWGIQIGFGTQYGVLSKRFDVGPYLGIGVQYNF